MLVTFYELNPLPDEVIHHHTRVFSCPAVVQVFWENKNIKKYKTYEVPQHIKITQFKCLHSSTNIPFQARMPRIKSICHKTINIICTIWIMPTNNKILICELDFVTVILLNKLN